MRRHTHTEAPAKAWEDAVAQAIANTPQLGISKLAEPHVLRRYKEHIFDPFKDHPIILLEIGIANGDSMRLFRDALPFAKIVGLDVAPLPTIDDPTGRIAMYRGEQQDTALLDRIRSEQAPNGFDVIIDDGSHVGQWTRIAFWHLFMQHLKPGGLYFIEDWGVSYWKNYPDGRYYCPPRVNFSPRREKLLNSILMFATSRNLTLLRRRVIGLKYRLVRRKFPSHIYGIVGFLKELVDECGIADVTDPLRGKGAPRQSTIEEMRVSVGLAMIVKRQTQA
jgi:hypothetical protein